MRRGLMTSFKEYVELLVEVMEAVGEGLGKKYPFQKTLFVL